jgi:hypothetical protein
VEAAAKADGRDTLEQAEHELALVALDRGGGEAGDGGIGKGLSFSHGFGQLGEAGSAHDADLKGGDEGRNGREWSGVEEAERGGERRRGG